MPAVIGRAGCSVDLSGAIEGGVERLADQLEQQLLGAGYGLGARPLEDFASEGGQEASPVTRSFLDKLRDLFE